jgi:hypothetical protein
VYFGPVFDAKVHTKIRNAPLLCSEFAIGLNVAVTRPPECRLEIARFVAHLLIGYDHFCARNARIIPT